MGHLKKIFADWKKSLDWQVITCYYMDMSEAMTPSGTRERTMNEKWIEFLRKNKACRDGYDEAHTKSPSEWWYTTKRGDWMIWVMRKSGIKIEKVVWVKIAVFCARQCLQNATPGDDRPRLAVEAAEGWIKCPTPAMESAAMSAAMSAAESAWSAAESAQADYIRTIIPDLDWSFLDAP